MSSFTRFLLSRCKSLVESMPLEQPSTLTITFVRDTDGRLVLMQHSVTSGLGGQEKRTTGSQDLTIWRTQHGTA